jgi:serine/threonine-protein kinase
VPAPPDTEPEPGLPIIPGYRMLAVLGRGGMATVYRAVHLEMDREVALKLISPGGRDEAAVRGRFTREVRSLGRIEHPNIVPVYDAGDWQGFHYYTMKLVPRGPLNRHLDRFVGDVRAAARLVAKVARAVGALHTSGVLHRDLKPLNILLGDHDEPLVADFGLARWIGDDSGPTESGSPVGTRPYMSPEQSLGSKTDYTPACDIWAVGIVLFEVLTGRRPFEADDPVELYLKIRGEAAPPASSLNPSVPPELDAVIARCLAKRPEDRYPTADAVADDLERWLAGKPLEVPVPSVRVVPVRSRRRRWVALGAGLAVVCGVVLAAVFWPKDEDAPPKRTIAERLAAGETVELIGETGGLLVEGRPVPGCTSTVTTAWNGYCTLTSTGYGAIELIHEPLPCQVRLETEVWIIGNDPRTTTGGVYFGRQETPFKGAIHQTALFLGHREERHPSIDPGESTVWVNAGAVTRWWGPPTIVCERSLRPPMRLWFQERSTGDAPPWSYIWSIVIKPGLLTPTLNGHPLDDISAAITEKALNELLQSRIATAQDRNPNAPPLELPTFAAPTFDRGIGLFVRHGDAVFRNTRLIPVK